MGLSAEARRNSGLPSDIYCGSVGDHSFVAVPVVPVLLLQVLLL